MRCRISSAVLGGRRRHLPSSQAAIARACAWSRAVSAGSSDFGAADAGQLPRDIRRVVQPTRPCVAQWCAATSAFRRLGNLCAKWQLRQRWPRHWVSCLRSASRRAIRRAPRSELDHGAGAFPAGARRPRCGHCALRSDHPIRRTTGISFRHGSPCRRTPGTVGRLGMPDEVWNEGAAAANASLSSATA
jgi:hypothetical protein